MSEERLVGEVEGFSTAPFLEAAEILARADEPERALRLLENLPARYRDNVPADVKAMRNEILRSLVTPHAYAHVDMDATVDPESTYIEGLPRGRAVKKLVGELNAQGRHPHIVDMGPGEYWLPIGLHRLGLAFTYHDVSLLERTSKRAREILPAEVFQSEPPGRAAVAPRATVFVAFELIEHLAHPRELAIEALRHCGCEPDYVFLSTPLYTFDGSKKDWRKLCGQPHLRAYTPQEFVNAALEIFPGYSWDLECDQIMVLKGTRNGG